MNRILSFSIIPLLAGAALAQTTGGGWRRAGDNGPQGPPPPDSAGPQAGQQPLAPPPSQLTIPAGTYLRVRVNDPISTDRNHPGDAFTVTLTQPLIAQGFVIARRGQTFGGRVANVDKGGRIKGTSQLALELTDLSLVDGQQIPIRSELIQFSGGTTQGRDGAAIAATTGVGAAIGAAADGGFGAGVGAGAGALASVIGVLATRGRATSVYPEDILTFRTLAAIPVSTDAAPQSFVPVQQSDYEPALQSRGGPARYGAAPPPPYYGRPYYAPYPYYGYGPSVFVYGGGYGYGGRRYRRW